MLFWWLEDKHTLPCFSNQITYCTNLTDLTSLIISDHNPYQCQIFRPSSNPSDWTSPHRSPCQAQQKVSLDGQLQTLPQTEVDLTEWIFFAGILKQ